MSKIFHMSKTNKLKNRIIENDSKGDLKRQKTHTIFPEKSLNDKIIDFYHNHRQYKYILEHKHRIKSDMENRISRHFPGSSIFITGSSSTGLGNYKCDLDMCLHIPDLEDDRNNICSALHFTKRLFHCGMLRSTRVIKATCPILKLYDRKRDIEIDLNINNRIGIYNTFLLKAYALADSRVSPLILLLKRWAKDHGINDASRQGISSYSLALMIINFLQVGCSPPVLPSLQMLLPDLFDPLKNDLRHFANYAQLHYILQSVWLSTNHEDMGTLLLKFFEYYAFKFDFDNMAPSVRLANIVSRTNVVSNIKNLKQSMNTTRKYICVEEPFNLTNTAYSTYNYAMYRRFRLALLNTLKRLKEEPSLEALAYEPERNGPNGYTHLLNEKISKNQRFLHLKALGSMSTFENLLSRYQSSSVEQQSRSLLHKIKNNHKEHSSSKSNNINKTTDTTIITPKKLPTPKNLSLKKRQNVSQTKNDKSHSEHNAKSIKNDKINNKNYSQGMELSF